MTIFDKVQKILDDALLPLGILSGHKQRAIAVSIKAPKGKKFNINADEYVVYRSVANRDRLHGDGKPLACRPIFDINYCYKTADDVVPLAVATARMALIAAAFTSNRWRIINRWRELYDSEAGFGGFTLEVACLEVL